MKWACFLHFYQPPTQTEEILNKVTDEAYRRIFKELENAPDAHLTLNVTSCLLDLWSEYGLAEMIDRLGGLLESGQVELTSSAKYHPVLPKLPPEEIRRQIELDLETHQKYFGDLYKPKGFFPPESAYNRYLAEIVSEYDFQWVLAEEISYQGGFGQVKYDRVYKIKDIPLHIFFRERKSSFKILSGQLGTVDLFEDYFSSKISKDEYLLTAMDGETFGHHRPGMEKLLFEIFNSSQTETVLVSDLLDLFSQEEEMETVPSTWALMEKDLERNAPFSRWDNPDNEIHQMQWELTDLAIEAVRNSQFKISSNKLNENLKIENSVQKKWLGARRLLDRALHSDQYWWASARPWWSLEMIERGAHELKEVVEHLPDVSPEKEEKAQNLYAQIIFTGFEWQRSGKVTELSRKEDEEVRERTDQGLPQLPDEEVDKMINNLREEMKEVAGREEFERAAQLRDRIKELEEYKREDSS